MSRPLRIEFPGAWHHVMNRGAGKRPIFEQPADGWRFLDVIGETVERFGIEIHAYALMGNHYHLLVRTPEPGLGRPMRHIGSVYTQWFNATRRTDGPLFRGRYKSLLVHGQTYLARVSRYIHLNPVDAGRVEHPEQDLWTSCRAYLGHAGEKWVRTDQVLGLFGNTPDEARRAYLEFLESGMDAETMAFYSRSRLPPVYADPELLEALRKRIGSVDRERLPDARRMRVTATVAQVVRAIAAAFEVQEAELVPKRGPVTSRVRLARGALIELGRQFAVSTLDELAPLLGYSSRSALSRARLAFRKALEESPDVQRRFRRATRFLHERADDVRKVTD